MEFTLKVELVVNGRMGEQGCFVGFHSWLGYGYNSSTSAMVPNDGGVCMVIVEGGLVLLFFGVKFGCVTGMMSSRATMNWHIWMESSWSCFCKLSSFWICWSKSGKQKGAITGTL